jgi:hypothetical protein
MPHRPCCASWTDQPHKSTCREPWKPTTAAEVIARRKGRTEEGEMSARALEAWEKGRTA